MPSKRTKSSVSFLPVAARWAFLAGLVISIIYGLIPSTATFLTADVQKWVGYVLMVLGILAGVWHVSKEDHVTFILLAIGLAVFGSSFNNVEVIGTYLGGVLSTLGFFLGIVVVGITVRYVVDWFADYL
jgi:hypothetical protein